MDLQLSVQGAVETGARKATPKKVDSPRDPLW